MIGVPGNEKSRPTRSSIRRPAVADERRQAPANADVEPRLRVHAVRQIHVVALVVGHHLERELVVVPQKERPLAAVGNGRRLLHDVGDRLSILQVQRHEDARHDREVIGHVAFVAVTEVGPHVGRQLVGLGQQHPAGMPRIDVRADRLDDGVRLGQVLAARAIALDQVRHGVEAEAIDAQIEPEVQHRQHLADDRRVVVVEIRLMMKKPVPVVRLRDRIPRPVRALGIDEDDPRLLVALVGIAPHVVVALRRSGRRRPRALEPWMLIGRVVEDQLDDDLQAALVRGLQELS